ncbi:HlyD family efflux transporter periplasmic adaptor subunit [Photobacterium galatheae]|uniref:HlyD family efflux transporter periplasmic adaptor subunit n=1 Tax=Photobacterium galatheae TaxID=1654360 RepID=UPI00137817B9|nr:HlyD family efflux transporter periplasmic adaptor subunit [Photobacterium galatheae]MCM0149080.1 HlyD family efflux transporter periplasmic adaptor subunit [Photobacterium galatheae]
MSDIELVSPGRGFVDGKNNTLQIKSHSTGNVKEIFVSSGSEVKNGDPLIAFDNHDVIFKSQSLMKNGSNLQSQLERAELDICTTRRLMDILEKENEKLISHVAAGCEASEDVKRDFVGVIKSYQWKAKDYFAYQEDVAALVEAKRGEAEMIRDSINITKSKIRRLEKHGATALQVEDAKRELNSMLQSLNENESGITKLQIDVSSKKSAIFNELSDRLTRTTDKLYDIKDELALNANELALAKLKIDRSTIHSPINGVVLSLEENVGVDYFLEESEAIMLLQKDESDVVISAKFLAKYRGDISLGMNVNIQPSLASAKTTFKGTITRISEDSFEDDRKNDDSRYYKVTIIPSENIPLSEGTEVNVFAVGGTVTVFDYIRSVLVKNKTIFEPY